MGEDWPDTPQYTGLSHRAYGWERIIVTGLENGVTYAFRVRANNSHGAGAWSDTRELLMVSPPSVMDAPTIESDWQQCGWAGCVTIAWEPPADDGGAEITKYVVIIRTSGPRPAPINVEPTVTSVQVTGLPADGREFRFAVRAFNPHYWGSYNQWSDAVGPVELEAPGAPIGFEVLEAWDGMKAVRWSPPPEDLQITEDGQDWDSNVFDSRAKIDTSTYGSLGLEDGVTYVARVRAVNSGGEGPWSESPTFTIGQLAQLEIPQPGKPTAEPEFHPISGDPTLRIQWRVGEVDGINGIGHSLGADVQYVEAGQPWSSAIRRGQDGGGPLLNGGHYGYVRFSDLEDGVRYASGCVTRSTEASSAQASGLR